MEQGYDGLYPKLTGEHVIYEKIMSIVDGQNGDVFFLYMYGGTTTTFIWRTMCSDFEGYYTSSGIA